MSDNSTMKKRFGFTMVELLVVIAIIGVLASSVLYSVGRARESGYAAKCRANLRNLSQGVLNLTTESDGYLPFAGGFEMQNWRNELYHEYRGWVNWVPKAKDGERPVWPNKDSQANKMQQPAWYGAEGLLGIRQGTLWANLVVDFVDGKPKGRFEPLNMMDVSSYVCPRFKRRDVCGRRDAVRSYAMNSFFGYEQNTMGLCSCCREYGGGIQLSTMERPASRTMLFAEIPVPPTGGNPTAANGGDQVLDAVGPSGNGNDQTPYESIGFIHQIAGKWCGHVVFVDGHVEVAHKLENGDNPTRGLALGER